MNASDPSMARPRLRTLGPWSWIWLVPIAAAFIVIALAVRSLLDHGPVVTISFDDAEGLVAGETQILHKDVDVGTVEAVYLSHDLSRVIVRARMRRAATEYLGDRTQFWIVRARVGAAGISGLSTIVSGSYIEMYPSAGTDKREFIGLDAPPAVPPGTAGHAFLLHADDPGALTAGSPVSYRGIQVGAITRVELNQPLSRVDISAFVRAPYAALVRPESRFWNSGGIDLSLGASGVRVRASSWQQLISGGVSFDTPAAGLTRAATDQDRAFRLYDSKEEAARDPRGPTLVYRIDLRGIARGIVPGAGVQLQGAPVGEVTDAHVEYDDVKGTVVTRVTIRIDSSRVEIAHRRGPPSTDVAEALAQRLESLVSHGLRAQLATANVLTGLKVISLDMVPGAPPARVLRADGEVILPSVGGTDLSDVLASASTVLQHIDTATAGPELGHAIRELDRTLTNLGAITADARPQIEPLLASLRAASDAANRALQAAHTVLGKSAATDTDLPRLIRELTDTARSVRSLTDYLDRHPEALIRGRKEADQ